MTTSQQLSVATEAISFQGDSFFRDLVAILGTIPREERASAKKDQWEKMEAAITKAVETAVGLKIEMEMSRNGNAAILVPLVDLQHIFYITHLDATGNPDDVLKFITKSAEELRADVDLKKSKISGSLAAKLESKMWLNREFMYIPQGGQVFTDEEVASLILHEVGHYFTMIEFLDRSVSTNQVLAELQRDLLANTEQTKRTTIIKKAGQELDLDRNTVQSMEKSDNKTITTVFMSAGLKRIRSQSGHSFYDMNTWEMLADQFATRHGSGSALFSAMNKLSNAYGRDSTMLNSGAFMARQAMTFVGGILLLTAGVYAIVAGSILYGILGIVFGLSFALDDHTSASEPTYDNDRSRLRRIRNQTVQAIKLVLTKQRTPFTQEYIKTLTDQVDYMDKIIATGNDDFSVMSKIAAFFSSNEANRQASSMLQKELEGLAHNDLYAKALALKTI